MCLWLAILLKISVSSPSSVVLQLQKYKLRLPLKSWREIDRWTCTEQHLSSSCRRLMKTRKQLFEFIGATEPPQGLSSSLQHPRVHVDYHSPLTSKWFWSNSHITFTFKINHICVQMRGSTEHVATDCYITGLTLICILLYNDNHSVLNLQFFVLNLVLWPFSWFFIHLMIQQSRSHHMSQFCSATGADSVCVINQ